MRLYTTTGATRIDDPDYGSFTPDANGAFDGLPDAMYAKLHGRPGWENDAEREMRVVAEQLEKLRDPATMLAELQKMSAGQGALTALLANALGVGVPAAPPTAAEAPPTPAAPNATTSESPPGTPVAKTSRARKPAANKSTATAPSDAPSD